MRPGRAAREDIMSGTRHLFSIVGLLVTMGWASYMVVRLGAQQSTESFDFSNASFAEVRDAQGQILLRGEFKVADDDEDEIERTAVLTAVGSDADASGEAEVEISKASQTDQDVELTVINVEPGGRLSFAIDGQDVATAAADRRGRIELERRVRSGRLQ
jgi:hypothetical protein